MHRMGSQEGYKHFINVGPDLLEEGPWLPIDWIGSRCPLVSVQYCIATWLCKWNFPPSLLESAVPVGTDPPPCGGLSGQRTPIQRTDSGSGGQQWVRKLQWSGQQGVPELVQAFRSFSVNGLSPYKVSLYICIFTANSPACSLNTLI